MAWLGSSCVPEVQNLLHLYLRWKTIVDVFAIQFSTLSTFQICSEALLRKVVLFHILIEESEVFFIFSFSSYN